MGKKKKQKQKLEVVFDPVGRKEFLTGFHKRKIERKKRAKTELNVLLNNEKKRIRQEVKDSVKNFKKSYEPCPDVQHLIDEEEYEDDVVQVKVIDLAAENIASRYNFIGQNRPKYSDDEKSSEDEAQDDAEESVPGMELKEKKAPVETPAIKIDPDKIKSKKDLNRFTKKTSNQSVRRNKLFKMKAKLDSVAGRKKASKEKKRNEKMRSKHQKRKWKPRGR